MKALCFVEGGTCSVPPLILGKRPAIGLFYMVRALKTLKAHGEGEANTRKK